MEAVGIISQNCRGGVNNKIKLEKLIHFLGEHEWKIALLQETSKISKRNIEKIRTGLDVFVIHSDATPSRSGFGVAILIKNEIKEKVLDYKFFDDNRGINMTVTLNNQRINIINNILYYILNHF